PGHPGVVDALEEAVEADTVAVFTRMRVVLDGRDPSDRAPVGPRQEVLRLGMLEERVLARREQGADVHPQLRHPQRVAAIVVVGEADELRETAPVRDGRDLWKAQMTPSSLPSRANTSSAWSICCAVWVAIRLVRSRQCDGGGAAVKMGGRELCFRKWITLSEPAAKPPIDARDLENVPTMMSTSSVRPKCAAVPSPRGPSTPTACASSSASAAPYFCAILSRPGTSAMSPSME